MKAKLIVFTIAILGFTLSSFTSASIQTLSGIYEGVEDTNYVFTIEKNGKTEKMIFNYLAEEVFENFDLDSDEYVGKSFNLTYQKNKELIENDNGKEEEIEYLTITKLELK